MEEILHHRGCTTLCKQWDIYHIIWCRISSINIMLFVGEVYLQASLNFPFLGGIKPCNLMVILLEFPINS